MMEGNQKVESDVESDVCRKADFTLRISEKISTINKDLAVVTKLRKLKVDSAINETLFEDMDRDDILKLTVNLVNQLIDVKVLLKDSRTILEDIDTLPSVQPSPQISSEQLNALQTKLSMSSSHISQNPL